jgi:DASH complex subunit DAM1
MAPAPRTPLRRTSQGSLFAQSRLGTSTEAPHDLSFLEFAMGELIDETDALVTNAEGMKALSDSLATFNESFASFLYVMNMNALTIDWLQVRKFENTKGFG